MKDAYSFDRDEEGLERSYELQAGAYERIFDRCGLRWHRVESDVGMMGGSGAHEYMAPCPAGENEVALAPGYAANVEVASAEPQAVELPARLDAPEEVATPGLAKVEEVAEHLGLPQGAFIKTLPIIVEGRGMVLVLLRGDHRLNEVKLRNGMGTDFRQAGTEEIEDQLGPVGYLGPVGSGLPIIKDAALSGDSYVSGANKPNTHLRGIDPSRDFESYEMDVRTVEAGDTAPGGGTIEIEPAIEIGNIFKLGTRYSEPLGATYLDEEGKERPIVMGSYGIGPARIAAAAIEQGADEKGIVWPPPIAPWSVHLVSLAKSGEEERGAADRIYEELRKLLPGEVLYDDRDAGPGEKLTDAELLGCPLRAVVGRRGLEKGIVETATRGGEEGEVSVEDAASEIVAKLGAIPLPNAES
jgi:prolyl-tRNA synthetase